MNNFLLNTNKYKLFSIISILINLFLLIYVFFLTNEISDLKNINEKNEKLLNSILYTKNDVVSVIAEELTNSEKLLVEDSKYKWIKLPFYIFSGFALLGCVIICADIPEKIYDARFVKLVLCLGLKYIFGPFDDAYDVDNSSESDSSQNDIVNVTITFDDNEQLLLEPAYDDNEQLLLEPAYDDDNSSESDSSQNDNNNVVYVTITFDDNEQLLLEPF